MDLQSIATQFNLNSIIIKKKGYQISKRLIFENLKTDIVFILKLKEKSIEECLKNSELSISNISPLINELSQDKKYIGFLQSYLNSPSSIENKIEKIKKLKEFFEKKEKEKNQIDQEKLKVLDLIQDFQIDEYHAFFENTRKTKRKLKLYIGPTNSGKTFKALNDLVSHSKGVYLSPLRLLALEGQEEIQKRGFICDLITGEEKEVFENSNFKSQTIETLNFNEYYDAVLIDEVQMLLDYSRGWAWSQALVGVNAKEVIMAGSLEIEPLIKQMAEILGEDLEIIHLERFNPLEVSNSPQSSNLTLLPEGSAIICFSRKQVLSFKESFSILKIPVSVIYGNLSPDVRKEEARKFKDGTNKFLISTDAIAMGLNLPISNIIFSTTTKFDGYTNRSLSPMEIKQIGGRAGRFGKTEQGTVSSFKNYDLTYIKEHIIRKDHCNNFLFIKPHLEHILKISKIFETTDLTKILIIFEKKIMKDNRLYFCSDLKEQITLSTYFNKISKLTLEDKFLFVNAPVPNDDFYNIFLNWIRNYSEEKTVLLPKINQLKLASSEKLFLLENYVKLLNLYMWCCFKKPEIFQDLENAKNQYKQINSEIERMLSKR